MADLPNRLKYEAELQKIVASTLAEVIKHFHTNVEQGTQLAICGLRDVI